MQEFFDVTIHTRAKGHSATAGVAYRVGQDLVEAPSGEEHRYAHREKDVLADGIEAGEFDSAESWAAAIEEAETRSNSQLYRDIKLALPCELSQERQVELTRKWSASLADHYRTSVLFAVHRPDRKSDQRNVHAHVVVPTRQLSAEASFVRGTKLRNINRDTISTWRAAWNVMQREELAEALHAGELSQEHVTPVALDLLCHLDHADEDLAARYWRVALECAPLEFQEDLKGAMPDSVTVKRCNERRRELHGQLARVQARLAKLQADHEGLLARKKTEGDHEALQKELARVKKDTKRTRHQRKAIRAQLAKDHTARRYTVAFSQATATGELDPEEAAKKVLSRPGVHLGAQAVALERQAAARKDRAAARAAGRRYRPVRRSVSDLLAYTGGASKRGTQWLVQLLQASWEDAKAAAKQAVAELRHYREQREDLTTYAPLEQLSQSAGMARAVPLSDPGPPESEPEDASGPEPGF